MITPVAVNSEAGQDLLARLVDRFRLADDGCQQAVTEIIRAIRANGDQALLSYIRRFDAPEMQLAGLKVTPEELDRADELVSDGLRSTIKLAIERIRTFHQQEMEESWTIERADGAVTGRLVRPVDSAGLYVPGGQGGKTPLVSSVLMNGIPAGIAGVARRVMVTPPDANGRINPALLVAAREIGISEIYKMGSAWAVAALAYGTESVAGVDVIVGPGNRYVTEAKRQVAGMVRIDMIAGPSEVLIVADETADPAFIAADMLAQAEHDPQALAMLITVEPSLVPRVIAALEEQLPRLSRQEIARASLAARGAILEADDLDQALELANRLAAEHLEIMVADPWACVDRIRHAGAIFLGHYSPEAVGDYLAGPNHVLPTMGTARYSSALGVETFLKKSSIIAYNEAAFRADAAAIQELAELEGLSAHAGSVAVRLGNKS